MAAPAAPGPRLRLDTAEPPRSEEAVAVELALEAVAQAASAAREAASAASTAQGRIAALERTVDGLRNDAQGQRDLSLQLRQRLARSEDASRWLWPLVAAVLALAGLVWWLARRLAGLRREHQTSWRTVATATAAPPTPADDHQPAAPMPFVTAAARAPAAKQPLAPAWPPPAPVESWDDLALQATQPIAARAGSQDNSALDTAMQRTEVLAPGARSATDDDAASPRDVSIEELIDLEQQAEFFVVLGQDDAAIELLAEHLRHTGGGSPLPYLKLLEIYRRRGDHDDYENIRARFNHRFNAYAPEWGSDLGAGRTLEDYPGILPRLEQAWVRPLDAMAEMEALLFRKSRGDLFELPAYRELLFLYSMARDLLDREVADSGSVDLLLPLVSSELGGEFGSTAPAPYLSLDAERGKQRTGNAKGDRPTPPALDFDLSAEGQRQTSIFDPLDQHGGPAKRR